MIFDQISYKTNLNSFYCPTCGKKLVDRDIPVPTKYRIDALPYGAEKAFLNYCFHYCPKCGYFDAYDGYLKLIPNILPTGMSQEQAALYVIKQYAPQEWREYMIARFMQYNDAPDYKTYFIAFLKNLDKNVCDGRHALIAADVARKLGEFSQAENWLRKAKKDKTGDVQAILPIVKSAIKQKSTDELVVPSITYFKQF